MRAAASLSMVLITACGAGDIDAPYTPPPPPCPTLDSYLAPIYALQDAGKLERLAHAVSVEVPEDARRDLVDALLRLLGSFERGAFSALETLPDAPDDGGPGLQKTLAKVLGWVAETGPSAPNLPLLGVLRRTLSTCEGAPILTLLEEVVNDPTLLTALGDLLGGSDLAGALEGLDFEGANGREATQYLIRNLLVAASSDAFSVDRVLDLLGLLVDLEQPPYDTLATSLRGLLDADGLPRLQGLLVCLRDVDPALDVGGFLYDLLTSGLLSDLVTPAADAAPDDGGSDELLPEPLRKILVSAIHFLATDAEARRALVPTLVVLLRDDLAPGVLGDVTSLLDAEALGGVVDLLGDLASGACRR